MARQTRAPLRSQSKALAEDTRTGGPSGDKDVTVGLQALRSAMAERGLSARSLAKLTGVARSTIGDWLTQKTRPEEVARKVMAEHLGIEPSSWDRVAAGNPAYPGQDQNLVPMPGYGQSPVAGDAQMALFSHGGPDDQSGKAGLRGAQQALAELDRRLRDPSLTAGDAVKYLSAKLTAAKTVAQLSGEVDASESAAWVRSPEGRHFLSLAAEALRPWPDAARSYAAALGVAYGDEVSGQDWDGDTTPKLAANSPTVESLEDWLGKLTDWLSHPDHDPIIGARAIDGIAYPTAGREREIAEGNPDLARRIGEAFDAGILRVQDSKIAHEPWAVYCRAVAVRLRNEATRGDRIVALTRDFGPLVTSRAREAFSVAETKPLHRH